MERIVVWLCLVVSPTQSCILEKRFFQRPVSVGILETSMSKTWEGVRAALHRAACRCATRAALGGAVAVWRSRTWRSLRAYSMDLREKIVASVKKIVPESETAYTLRSGGCDHGA